MRRCEPWRVSPLRTVLGVLHQRGAGEQFVPANDNVGEIQGVQVDLGHSHETLALHSSIVTPNCHLQSATRRGGIEGELLLEVGVGGPPRNLGLGLATTLLAFHEVHFDKCSRKKFSLRSHGEVASTNNLDFETSVSLEPDAELDLAQTGRTQYLSADHLSGAQVLHERIQLLLRGHRVLALQKQRCLAGDGLVVCHAAEQVLLHIIVSVEPNLCTARDADALVPGIYTNNHSLSLLHHLKVKHYTGL